MTNTYTIEVATKFGQSDARNSALLAQLPLIPIVGAKDIRVSALYEITGRMTRGQAQQLTRDLLTDPIVEESRMDQTASSQAFLVGPHWRIEVWLKPTVTDTVGESVLKGVRDLGLPEPEKVRTGTAYRVLGRVSRPQIDKLVEQLLANPVIHQTTVTQA